MIQLLINNEIALLSSLFLTIIRFNVSTMATTYFMLTMYCYGFLGLLYNFFCSCFLIFAYEIYNERENCKNLVSIINMVIGKNNKYKLFKTNKKKINDCIDFVENKMYDIMIKFKNYTREIKYFKKIYDLYENIFCFDYKCIKKNNIEVINNTEVINNIKENMTENEKNEIDEINKFMNNMTDDDKKKISEISQALFSSFEL